MLATARHPVVCASCRLDAIIASKQLLRQRGTTRSLTSSSRWQYPRARRPGIPDPVLQAERAQARVLAREGGDEGLSVDERVLRARRQYGDEVPEGVLHEEGMRVWERLYGKIPPRSDGSVGPEAVVKGAPGTGMLRLADDGALEEVEFEGGCCCMMLHSHSQASLRTPLPSS